MNSMSKYFNNEENEIQDNHINYDDRCQHPLPGKALLKCNNGSFPSTDLTFTDTPIILNRPIGSVSIDTTCLRNPNLLIDFAGILTNIPITVVTLATLNFTLFRICKGIQVRQPVATFSFSVVNIFPFADSRTLKFEFSTCSDDLCEACCTYTLELTSITNLATGIINFSIDGKLCALAIESPQ